MNIAVAGIVYVGVSNAVLLAQHNHVTAVDIEPERVKALRYGRSPVSGPEMEQAAQGFAHILAQGALETDIPQLFMGLDEAKACDGWDLPPDHESK